MDDELVLLNEYTISRDIINEISKNGQSINEQDIETDLHQILKDNNIKYKTKIKENWSGMKTPRFDLIAQIYVYKSDHEKALKLLSSLKNRTQNEEKTQTKKSSKTNPKDAELEQMKIKHEQKARIISYFICGISLAIFIFFILFAIVNYIYYFITGYSLF